MEIEERVKHYWTVRSHDFGAIRKNELEGDMGRRWLEELDQWLPKGKTLDILDVGTGTGFFAILLAGMGHRVTGIDLTPAMLEEGRAQAAQAGLSIDFRQMDAQEPDFPEGSFDVVLSRNLTWTLPDPEKAYSQWLRVLRRGGLLLNFDADYGHDSCNKNISELPPEHAHCPMPKDMLQECEAIKSQLTISSKTRPSWDMELLSSLGYKEISADTNISTRIYKDHNEFFNPTPMFLIRALKP